MNTATGRVFGYGRVSTADQTTENQRLELASKGYSIADYRWFADDGVSGTVPAMERPAFVEMITKLEPGDTLVVSKIDRLGRNALDVQSTVAKLTEMKVRVIVDQLGNMDITSGAGKLMMTMLSAVAEMERELTIERTKAGQARAWGQGKTKGRPCKTTASDRQQITEQCRQGVSVSQLARDYKVSRATIIGIRDSVALL